MGAFRPWKGVQSHHLDALPTNMPGSRGLLVERPMNRRLHLVLTGFLFALAFDAKAFAQSNTQKFRSWTQNAGHMYSMAASCNEGKQTLDRFHERVMILVRIPSSTASEWDFIEAAHVCGLYERHCINPYAQLSCEAFLKEFRHLRINLPQWQPDIGFR
jgi:hypothetical protein